VERFVGRTTDHQRRQRRQRRRIGQPSVLGTLLIAWRTGLRRRCFARGQPLPQPVGDRLAPVIDEGAVLLGGEVLSQRGLGLSAGGVPALGRLLPLPGRRVTLADSGATDLTPHVDSSDYCCRRGVGDLRGSITVRPACPRARAR
jgi:hypothetical protein